MEKTWGRSRGPILCETLQLTTDVSANALISWHVTGVWGQRRVSVLLEWKDRLLDGQSQPHSSSCDQSPASLTVRSFLVKGRDSHQDGIGVRCLHVVGAQPLSLSGCMSLPRREPPPVARWRLALPLSCSAPRVLWLWCYLARRRELPGAVLHLQLSGSFERFPLRTLQFISTKPSRGDTAHAAICPGRLDCVSSFEGSLLTI